MKTILKSILVLFPILCIVPSCSGQRDEAARPAPTFKTPEAAAEAALRDLREVLQAQRAVNLDIDPEKLSTATAGDLMEYRLIDFDKLLAADSVHSLEELVASTKGMIVPFISGDEVVAVAQVGRTTDGWRVSELGNKSLRTMLNQMHAPAPSDFRMTFYEVPNLQILIAAVQGGGDEQYFLHYQQFTPEKPAPIAEFYPLIRDEAVRFDKEFGDELKREKLVK